MYKSALQNKNVLKSTREMYAHLQRDRKLVQKDIGSFFSTNWICKAVNLILGYNERNGYLEVTCHEVHKTFYYSLNMCKALESLN